MLQIQPPYMFAVRPYLFCFVVVILVVGYLYSAWFSSLLTSRNRPPEVFLEKRCSKNIQEICRRIPLPKCDFNKVALHIFKHLFWRAAFGQRLLVVLRVIVKAINHQPLEKNYTPKITQTSNESFTREFIEY